MKCRAKMIDGSPVTFEITAEEVVDRYGHPHLQQDAIGEGFFVRSVPYAYWGGIKYRDDRMRVALDLSGVDTATVEYWTDSVQPRNGWWSLMFPPAYPNGPIKSWAEVQSRQPVGVSVAMEFECPTEIDTYDQKMAKAAKWARGEASARKAIYGTYNLWALDLLAGLAEDFVKTPAPSTEPTEAMTQAGWAALIDSPLYGEPRKTIQMVWRAMEKAR